MEMMNDEDYDLKLEIKEGRRREAGKGWNLLKRMRGEEKWRER